MHINQLPDDILAHVFRWYRASTFVAPEDWSKLLPLLSVCKYWRQLAAAEAYSTAFLVAQPAANTLSKPKSRFDSNILLALLTKNASHMRNLYIESNTIEAAYLYLKMVERHFDLNGEIEWHKIRSLTLRQIRYQVRSEQQEERMRIRLYNRFIRFVTRKMPNISSLRCLIIDDDPAGSYVGNRLTDFYACQLKYLKSLIPLTLAAPRLSNQLTFLQVSISGKAGHQLPLVYRDTLKHLSLCNVPRNYQWKSFVYDEQENVEFANLKHLEIYYKLDSQRHGSGDQTSGPVLSFPKLKRLYLFRCYEHCQLLESARFPERLENVYLHCAPFLLAHLLRHRWERIDNLEVNIEAGAIDSPKYFFKHTSMLYGNGCLAKNASLTLGELPRTPHPLDWSRMTSLTIIYQLKATQLLVLLENMPGLAKLSVLSLDVNSLPASIIHDKRIGRFKRMENSTLTFAKLNAVDVKPCGPSYLAFIRYFVLKYVSLEHLCVNPSVLFYTRALVEAYSRIFPHLATTNVFASSELY